MSLYRQYADTTGFPDTRPLFGQLGIEVQDGQAHLNDNAELAFIREAVMRPLDEPAKAVDAAH